MIRLSRGNHGNTLKMKLLERQRHHLRVRYGKSLQCFLPLRYTILVPKAIFLHFLFERMLLELLVGGAEYLLCMYDNLLSSFTLLDDKLLTT